jgi:hypothetical protein
MLMDIPTFRVLLGIAPKAPSMKYTYSISIKDVVINLKRVGVRVKADKQPVVFDVFIVFKVTVIFDSINSPSNICFFYAMFKRRLTKAEEEVKASSTQPLADARLTLIPFKEIVPRNVTLAKMAQP